MDELSKQGHKRNFSLPAAGILIENHRHRPGFKTKLHSHRCDSFIYVVAGGGRCITGQKEYILSSNTAILFERNRKHQLIDNPRKPMVVYVVYFSRRKTSINSVLLSSIQERTFINIPIQYARCIRNNLRQMLYEQNSKPIYYEYSLRQLLLQIIIHLGRLVRTEDKSNRKSSERVQTILEYVAEQYYLHNSLSEVSRAANLSQRQFTNICKKLTGMSYIRYLNTCRCKKARTLLEKTDMPISAIAFEVGYEDISTFYRAFRRVYSMSPAQLRAKTRCNIS